MKPFSFYFLLFSLFFLFLPGTPACAQSTVTGRDFWVGFLHNGYKDSVQHAGSTILTTHQTLVVLSQSAGTVTASCQLWHVTETLVPGVAKTISVPYEDTYSGPVGLYTRPSHSRRPNYGAIHVTSTTDITLYALNNEPGRSSEPDRSADATLVLPTASLGRHYLLQDYLPTSSTDSISPWDGGAFCIVATRNNTSVDILFHNDIQIDTFRYGYTNAYQPLSHTLHAAGSHFRTVTLNRGQYIQFLTPPGGSFSGTEVTADSPVALFMGRKYAAVPNALNHSPDHLYQQAMPVERWGRDFLVVPDHRTGTALDHLSIATLDDGCQLSFTTVAAGESYTSQTLQAGQTLLLPMPADHSPLLVSATKPIALSLYLAGHAGRGNLGDPSVIAVPPLNQTTASARLFTRFDTNHANIVVPTAAVSGMRLDGADISSLFTPFASTPYSYASLPVARSAGVTTGSHLLTNLSGQFNAWCYGFNPEASFASPVGMSLRNLRQELLVAGLPNYTWDDTVPLCGLTQHFAIHTDGETDTRWYVDNVLQSSTDTALDHTFSSAGLHTVTALQRGGCTAPDFCDTLTFLVRLYTQAIAPTTQQVYVDQFPYTLNGITYDSAGSYTQHLTAANGCDSVVHLTLSARLHANNDTVTTPAGVPVVILPTLNDSIDCPNPTVNIISYAWHGSIAVHDGNNEGYRDDYDDILGNDSPTETAPPQEVVYYQDPDLFYDPTWTGLDSIQIVVICDNDNRDTSWIFVRVVNPTDTFAVACDDFVWYGDTLIASATRYHTIRSSSGEDSILRLHLTVNRSTTGDTTATACDSFIWWNTNYTNSTNTPIHVYTNTQGCDSIVTLHLTVNYSTTGIEDTTACNSFVWHGTEYTESTNTPVHVYTNTQGCDSTVTLHLTINPCSSTTITACDSYTWNETTYTASGIYDNGIDTLYLTINHSTSGIFDTTVCDLLTWWNTDFTDNTDSATHTFVGGNTAGCDSVVTLHLTVNHSSAGDTSAVDCNAFTWWNTNYTNSTNTPIYVYTNSQGCDSTVTLHLTINHCSTRDTLARDSITIGGTTYTDNDTVIIGYDTIILTICHTFRDTVDTAACNLFAWRGMTFVHDTVLSDTILKADGCDSITTLNLTINQCSTRDTLARDSITIGGTTYTDNDTVIIGYDTIILTVCHTFRDTLDTAACNLFAWRGMSFVHDTVMNDTILKSDGCDSIITLKLTINHCSTIDTLARDSITIGGTTYTDNDTVIIGYDTIILTVCHTFRDTIDTAACNLFAWRGMTFVHDTVMSDTILKADGCDSITTLNLTINHCSTRDTLVRDSITIGGTTYTDNDTIIISHDTIILTVCHTFRDTVDTAACNLFAWRGMNLLHDTVMIDTIVKADGCDSITTLNLTINHCSTTTQTVCDSMVWHGVTYTASGVYTDGTDTLVLTVNYSSVGDTTAEACNSFTWWATGDTYTADTILNSQLSILNSAGCDSTVTLHLTINHCSTRDTLARDSITIGGTTYTDNDTVIIGYDTIILTVCHTFRDTVDTAACNLFAWRGMTFVNDTVMSDTILKSDGCDSITTLNLTINHCSTRDTLARDSITIGGTTYTDNDTIIIGHDTIILTVCYTFRDTIDTAACNLFAWRGMTFVHDTVMNDTILKADGCDSITTLSLTINHCSSTTQTVCDSLVWHGVTYTASGVYTDGTDTLVLTVDYSTTGDTTATACNTFTWWATGITYTADTTLNSQLSILNSVGCDSTVTLHLTINHCSTRDTLVRDSITIGGTTYVMFKK